MLRIITIIVDRYFYQRVGLIVLLYLVNYNSLASSLKVAILDTAFCPNLIKSSSKIHIRKPIDLTNSHQFTCKDITAKEINSKRLFHGQLVLKRFIEELSDNFSVDIQPFQIFDKFGFTKSSYWKEAVKSNSKFDLFIIAAGVKVDNKEDLKSSTIAFVSGATFGRGINKTTPLWPQLDYKSENIIMIGSYLPPIDGLKERADHTLIHPYRIEYFFEAGSDQDILKGSSRAVATAAAQAINICRHQFGQAQKLIDCLDKKKKMIKLENNTTVHSF